jgi:hypothetical protein
MKRSARRSAAARKANETRKLWQRVREITEVRALDELLTRHGRSDAHNYIARRKKASRAWFAAMNAVERELSVNPTRAAELVDDALKL